MARSAPAPIDPAGAVEAEIVHLERLDRAGLRARWRVAMGRTAPPHLGRGLLCRILAYRLQVDRFGDLDPGTRRFLDRIAAHTSMRTSVPLPDAEIIRPGTLLVREWQGVRHRVEAVAEGFVWEGRAYGSLSQVARAITGAQWNGPRFFGLRGGRCPGSQDQGRTIDLDRRERAPAS